MSGNGKKVPTVTTSEARDLIEFAADRRRDERRRECAVCQLPDDIRAQVRVASRKKIDVLTVLEWLDAKGHPINEVQYKSHGSGAHDIKDAADAAVAKGGAR